MRKCNTTLFLSYCLRLGGQLQMGSLAGAVRLWQHIRGAQRFPHPGQKVDWRR